jgi:hypothetical protein
VALERRRLQAARLLEQGCTEADVARWLRVHHQSVNVSVASEFSLPTVVGNWSSAVSSGRYGTFRVDREDAGHFIVLRRESVLISGAPVILAAAMVVLGGFAAWRVMKYRLSNKERVIEQKGATVEILNERDLSNQPKLANRRKLELGNGHLKIKFVSIKDSQDALDKQITIGANERIVIQSSSPIFVDGSAGDFIIKIDLDSGTRDQG